MTDRPAVLADVKVGDKLYVSSVYGAPHIVTVERISSTGRVTAGGRVYYPSGRLRGDDAWYPTRATPATQPHLDEIERERLIKKIRGTSWRSLSLQELDRVAAIVDEAAQKNKPPQIKGEPS